MSVQLHTWSLQLELYESSPPIKSCFLQNAHERSGFRMNSRWQRSPIMRYHTRKPVPAWA